MAPLSATSSAFGLPQIRETFRLPSGNSILEQENKFYDVKFYPYHTSSTKPPIFAIVGHRQILLGRPSLVKGVSLSIVAAFRDLEPDEGPSELNSCTWNFITQDKPLLSVAGSSAKIKVLDALTGVLVTTLIGHGDAINDLATHPRYPWILASASTDHSVRVWDLRRRMEDGENACLIICGHGQSHKESILTVSWHIGGRYLISAGLDLMLCVWTIPDLSPTSDFFEKDTETGRTRSVDETTVIHYPHFVTSAIHSNYVDCVCFYGDLVLSKPSMDNKIVLWSITDFSSKLPPPGPDRAPKTAEFKDTRNGFVLPPIPRSRVNDNDESADDTEEPGPITQRPLFERLLEFSIPNSESFYMRFSLLTPSPSHPDLHPILAYGNVKSKISFWDLSRLEFGHDGGTTTSSTSMTHDAAAADEHGFLRPDERGRKKKGAALRRVNSVASSTLHPHHFGGGGSSSSHAVSPAPPSSPSSRRSSSIATGVSSNPQDNGRANSTPQSILSTPGVVVVGPVIDRVRYPLHLPFEPLPPHHTVTVKKVYFTARQAAWSPCGRWCIVVGETGADALGVLCERWTSH